MTNTKQRKPIKTKLTKQFPVHECSATTYSVSVWNHEEDCWEVRYPRVHKWDVRRLLRGLYAEGWDTVSVLVTNDQQFQPC